MSRGFVILGIDTDVDNVKYASALSMTIKNCDVNSEVCLVTDVGQVVDPMYYDCFDYITELIGILHIYQVLPPILWRKELGT